MTLLIIFFLLSISFSFLCSIWEAVILSITPKYINKLKNKGDSVGTDLAKLKEDIDRPLSAILTLNTIAHTVGAIGVGAQASALFGSTKINLFVTEITGEFVVAVVMTLAILILSEIIPKTIGANMWEQLAPFTTKSLKFLLVILYPLVWVTQLITKSFKKDKNKSVLSRSDFQDLTKEGVESGAIDQKESKIIANLLRLDRLSIKDIMTPRTVMFSMEETVAIRAFYENHKETSFSRIPVYQGKSDLITGFVLKDDLLLAVAEGKLEDSLLSIKRDISFVQDDAAVTEVFNILLPKREHIAIVNDSYGSVIGLVTMEDVFETLLGLEIMDESDKVEDMQKHARSLWQERSKKQGDKIN